jgi:hypothetical protein
MQQCQSIYTQSVNGPAALTISFPVLFLPQTQRVILLLTATATMFPFLHQLAPICCKTRKMPSTSRGEHHESGEAKAEEPRKEPCFLDNESVAPPTTDISQAGEDIEDFVSQLNEPQLVSDRVAFRMMKVRVYCDTFELAKRYCSKDRHAFEKQPLSDDKAEIEFIDYVFAKDCEDHIEE